MTAIGEYISQVSGIASLFFNSLQRRNLNVEGIAQNGERIISVILKKSDLDEALRAVYSAHRVSI